MPNQIATETMHNPLTAQEHGCHSLCLVIEQPDITRFMWQFGLAMACQVLLKFQNIRIQIIGTDFDPSTA